MTIKQDIQSLAPTALMELFVLDTTNLPGGSITRFHAGTNGLTGNVVWQGQTYTAFPIQADGFDKTTKGTLPRPKIRIANVNGLLSAEVAAFNDYVGCKVTRKRTFAKYLDAANFPAQRNLLRYTAYDATNWTTPNGNCTVTTGIDAPDGSTTAVRVKTAGSAAATFRLANQSISIAANTQYTLSFWCRLVAGASPLTADIGDGNPQGSYLSQLALNEWRRVTINGTRTTGATATFLDLISDTGASVTLDFWHPQLEVGTSPTDYQEVAAAFSANPYADPNQYMPDDIWYVERKLSENRYVIEFELSSSFDLMGQQLPNRQIIQNSCPWKYRGTECAYAGGYIDINNATTTDATKDVCAKTVAACRARFGTNIIRFGGFPGAVRGTT